ncbi:MAG: hypothetical protein HRT43_11320 [Campylobacteraceae bacterium]|nr:hypothetical protein [Campylobacteraceae bacterium]
MKKIFKYLLFFVGIGLIWANSSTFELSEILKNKEYQHARAHACYDLKTVGVIYCFDDTNPNYMTIPLFENLNEKKTFIRLKDEGEGLAIIVFEKKVNKYQEVFSKVRIKNKGYDGWINDKLIHFE